MKYLENFNNFDINKDIEKSTDIEYLKELERYVDMDIDNIGKELSTGKINLEEAGVKSEYFLVALHE
jgi:hypothetical protein